VARSTSCGCGPATLRSTAAEAGRDPARIEHTRWASLETDPAGVEAFAQQGVTRLVVAVAVAVAATNLDQQRRDVEASQGCTHWRDVSIPGCTCAYSGCCQAVAMRQAHVVATGRFVLHDHRRPRRHADLRLEENGVLRSWAVPRGLPEDPRQNRLAIHVPDHDTTTSPTRTPTSRSPTPARGNSRTATTGDPSSSCGVARVPAGTH
jgi:DNA polymerase Ligase (LigD)